VQTPAVDQHQVGAVACCVSVQIHQSVLYKKRSLSRLIPSPLRGD
jgi:hypothetical protein